MNYCDLAKAGPLLLAGGLALAACAPKPNPALNQARSSVSSAATNPDVARYAAYPLAEANENLSIAQQAWDNREPEAKVTHYANLAQTQSEIANSVAKRRMVQAQTLTAARQVTLGDMLFQVGKADLNPRGQKAVSQLATFLRNNPDRNVVVSGYTDSTGSAELNAKLSQERANAVKTALVSQGVPAQRIAASGRGPANPVASNATAEGRQQNRRVAVDISGPGGVGMGSTAPPR